MCPGSSAGGSSEGGTGEVYSGLPEVAAVFGRSAVHFADVRSARVTSCSLTFADSEMLRHAVAVHSGEEVWGSELFAVDCSVWDQWSCRYLG